MTQFKIAFMILALALTQSCGRDGQDAPFNDSVAEPIDLTNAVIKAKATFEILTSDATDLPEARLISVTQPVKVTADPNVQFTIDNSTFKPPTITNAILNFGNLKVSNLIDNALSVCGISGTDRCTNAAIRIYTTGVAGPGLWNDAGGYGAPMKAKLKKALPIGLDVAGAVVMQTLAIPVTKNVIRLTDFKPNPNYNFTFDFSNAGAGNYSTTIVVEYLLVP